MFKHLESIDLEIFWHKNSYHMLAAELDGMFSEP